MNDPKISIIMGIYNCGKMLPAAIDSILNQTYQNWELIMCDDGSSDDTYDVAKKYQDSDSRIKVIKNEKNMRLAYSLNRCLKVAKGEYVARLDADDSCTERRLETEVTFLENHPEYAVVGSAIYIREGNEIAYVRKYPEYPMKNVVWSSVPFAHPTIMMRKMAYDKLNGYRSAEETMRAEDLDLWFRFKLAGFDGYNIQEPLYIYQESIDDYKKRSLKAGIQTSTVMAKYYKELNNNLKWRVKLFKAFSPAESQ